MEWEEAFCRECQCIGDDDDDYVGEMMMIMMIIIMLDYSGDDDTFISYSLHAE